MLQITTFFTTYKKQILIVVGLLLAIFLYKKSCKNGKR